MSQIRQGAGMLGQKGPALDTKTAILHAALACFADHGYEGTSIRMIAERAGRPLSLLAHHFGNKENLYVEVFRYLFEWSMSSTPEAREPRDAAEAARFLREELHRTFKDMVQKHEDKNPLREQGTRLWLQEIREPRPALHDLIRNFAGPMATTIRNCLTVLRPDLNPDEIAFLGASIIGQVVGHGFMAGLNRIIWGDRPLPPVFQGAEILVEQTFHGLLREGAPAPVAAPARTRKAKA